MKGTVLTLLVFAVALRSSAPVSATPSIAAHGINNAGVIVGSYFDGTNYHGFLKDKTTFVTIDVNVPGDTYGAYGINDHGQVVGTFNHDTGAHGFLKNGDTYTTLGVPGWAGAAGINNSGQIVGTFRDADLAVHGYLETGNMLTILDVPDSGPTWGFAINDAGQILMQALIDGSVVTFLTDAHVYTMIDVRGTPTGINDSGQIVGFDGARGFLKTGDTYTSIMVPGSLYTFPQGINDRGEIVGYFSWGGEALAFVTHGVNYTTFGVPTSITPEPESLAFVTVLAIVIALSAGKGRRALGNAGVGALAVDARLPSTLAPAPPS